MTSFGNHLGLNSILSRSNITVVSAQGSGGCGRRGSCHGSPASDDVYVRCRLLQVQPGTNARRLTIIMYYLAHLLRRVESGFDHLPLPEELSFQRVSLGATIISEL